MARSLLYAIDGTMRRVVALIAVLLGAGCLTPSIPIPPPDPALMDFMVAGSATATTAAFEYPPDHNYIGSTVFIFNRHNGTGVIDVARPDGSVGPTPAFAAQLGDQVVVTFQNEDQTVSTCIRLREGSQSSTDYCDQP